jgi:hypothetical protein
MFRFTIRDVLWLVLAVALALSWQLDRRLANKQLATMEDERDKSTVRERTWKMTAKGWEKRYFDGLNAHLTRKASPVLPPEPNP